MQVSGLTTLTLLTLLLATSHGSPWTGFIAPSESYSAQTFMQDVEIPMDDGTVLRANLTLPALADGSQAPGRFPSSSSRPATIRTSSAALMSRAATRGTAMFMCSST